MCLTSLAPRCHRPLVFQAKAQRDIVFIFMHGISETTTAQSCFLPSYFIMLLSIILRKDLTLSISQL